MEGISIPLQIVAVLVSIGALGETFFPGLFSEQLKKNLTSITIAMIGILLSFVFLMWFLKLRVREGFTTFDFQTVWNSLITSNKVEEVCALYTEIYEKMLAVEKGAPPEPVKTDAQARESVDAKFASVMTEKPISCHHVKECTVAKDLDSFYIAIQKLSPRTLVQNYETAIACRRLLIDSYLQVQQAEQRREEAFQDKPLCDEGVAKERKAYLERNTLSEAAQKCQLAEEIPTPNKEAIVRQRLSSLESTFTSYYDSLQKKESIQKILEDCAYYKGELDKKKKEAEDMSKQFDTTK
jgi:hypothetical protein